MTFKKLTLPKLILPILVVALPSASFAKIELTKREDRLSLIREASVWSAENYAELKNITPEELMEGPKAKGYAKLYKDGDVFCQTNEDDQNEFKTGKTPKFYCQLMEKKDGKLMPLKTKKGERRVIKVKYSPVARENREIKGEVLGTRLLWALGFYADQMFYVEKVHCFGCTEDPFSDRRVDPTHMKTPKTFSPVLIEKEFDGEKISLQRVKVVTDGESGRDANRRLEPYWYSGLKFREMMRYLSVKSARVRSDQITQRDALRLLAIFMNHVDVKGENQRLSCLEKDEKDNCTKPILMIQDIGTSFGVNANLQEIGFDKVHIGAWSKTPIWTNAQKCEANFTSDPLINTFMADASMRDPQISEAGRAFLAKLLRQFSSDQRRVRALFEAAHVESQEIDTWVKTFNQKVYQIVYPMGKDHRDFKCPSR